MQKMIGEKISSRVHGNSAAGASLGAPGVQEVTPVVQTLESVERAVERAGNLFSDLGQRLEALLPGCTAEKGVADPAPGPPGSSPLVEKLHSISLAADYLGDRIQGILRELEI